jgi:hypothetical protein
MMILINRSLCICVFRDINVGILMFDFISLRKQKSRSSSAALAISTDARAALMPRKVDNDV